MDMSLRMTDHVPISPAQQASLAAMRSATHSGLSSRRIPHEHIVPEPRRAVPRQFEAQPRARLRDTVETREAVGSY